MSSRAEASPRVGRYLVSLLFSITACATVQPGVRGGSEEAPTLDVPHARGGELPALPESLRPAQGAASLHVSYRVCVRPSDRRAISVVRTLGDGIADASLVPALSTASWELREPVAGDELRCFLENLEAAPDGAWKTAAQPYLLAGPDRIEQSGDAAPQLPQEALQRLVGKDVVGLYRMCAAPNTGAVASITPVVSVPGADSEISAALRTWKYKPTPAESCWIEPLRFTLKAAAPSEPRQQDLSKMPQEKGKGFSFP